MLPSILDVYRKHILARFPNVIVLQDYPRDANPYAGDYEVRISVFDIPDDRMGEWTRFCTHELLDLLFAEKLPSYGVASHSATATSQYYPDVLEMRDKEQS